MGVTIEQYGARIGAHNNVRIKVDSTQLEVNVILVGNNNYDINYIQLMLIFYMIVIYYLPTKRLTEQYKSFR